MRVAIFLVIAGFASAQVPKSPVTYGCTPEDLDTAGLTCSAAHPCAVYLELASIETVGGKIFLAGNLHTDDVTLTSILLASGDDGRTWTEPHSRIPGAGLEQIQFVDFQNGWIGGGVLQGRPRDPFLLVTHDGGKTWHRQPLFEETRTGIIQQFWFESKDTGGLLVDRMQPSETGSRYELYESRTGGDSWTLLEVSASQLAIRKARGSEPNPDWRLRADGPTKTLKVEQRVAEKWRSVAAFPVRVTECKSAEVKLEEPPPAEEEAKPAETPKPAPSLKKKR